MVISDLQSARIPHSRPLWSILTSSQLRFRWILREANSIVGPNHAPVTDDPRPSRMTRQVYRNSDMYQQPFLANQELMSLPNTVLPREKLEIVGLRPLVREEVSAARPRSQSKPSLPSRIAVIGNYLPRQCGIATFTTDEYGTALLALPVNDTEEGYDYPARVRCSFSTRTRHHP